MTKGIARTTSDEEHMVRVLTPGEATTVTATELPPVLAALSDQESQVTWLHTELSPLVIQALDEMGLDEIAVKSLRDGPERPRVEEFADHLYVSLFSADRLQHLQSTQPGHPAVDRRGDGVHAPVVHRRAVRHQLHPHALRQSGVVCVDVRPVVRVGGGHYRLYLETEMSHHRTDHDD
jgi:Mg2+ and Co2+ transporter CorA